MAMPAPLLLADRFRLGETIGHGSVSEVYGAVDLVTGREVAVKLAPADPGHGAALRRRYQQEAAALSVIASPQVVELVSAGTTEDGRAYLVLERLHGRNLQELLVEVGSVPPRRVAQWIGQAAAALELAHGLGIVHRDLKPANLFLHAPAGARPTVKVLDFGLVVDVEGPTERGHDAFGGTPLYMAPEQVRGQLTRIGPATDIWALAMVAITLLTGEPYWAGATVEELLREIESTPTRPPSTRWPWLGAAFDAWFARSTQRVPERRFRDGGEQARQLARALRDVVAPDRSSTTAALAAASTISPRTPPPVLLRSGDRRTVVGRTVEHAEIEALIAPGVVVTLAGTAGIGKTCLAQVVCGGVGERFADGAWFVPLGAGEDPGLVVAAIAAALAIPPDLAVAPFDALVAQLAPRRVLVVLDGAEQVIGSREEIDRLRRACPSVAWLVTSRLPLGLEGERCVGIEPLELPGPQVKTITPDEALTFSAIDLFYRRAREADPGFVLDADQLADVVAICRLLDGFPHGIELAAAQLAASTPARVRAQLQTRDQRASTSLEHGGSVPAAVAWSYDLLATGDQAVLRHLAVFPAGVPLSRASTLFAHLVDHPEAAVRRLVQSRLLAWSGDEEHRLHMLDSVRDHGRRVSAELGEEPALWRLACQHVEALATSGGGPGGRHEEWLALVDREQDNLRAVLSHLLEHEPTTAMALAGRLTWYWYLRGHYAEGSAWLEEAIARSAQAEGDELVRALHGAGRLALLGCRYQRAEELLERARHLASRRGDARGEAEAVQLLGSVARERGAYEPSLRLHRRGLELWERLGDAREAARARNYLIFVAWLGDAGGDPGPTAREWLDHAGEAELRALGDPEILVWSLLNRGATLHYAGHRDAARDVLRRAFAEAIAARFHEGIAWALDLGGLASFERGELLQAHAQLSAALRVHRRLGDLWRCASVLEALAAVAVAGRGGERGALYLGIADELRAQLAAPVPRCERALLVITERRGAVQAGDAFAASRAHARRLPLDRIIALSREIH